MKAFTFAPSSLIQLGFIATALVRQVVPADAYFCCSHNTKDCTGDEWCDANDGNCGACNGLWMDPNSIPENCIARWGECTYDIYDCCPSNVCVGDQWYKQCIENPSTTPVAAPPDGTSHPSGQLSSMPSGAPSQSSQKPSSKPSTAPVVTTPPTPTGPGSFCCSHNTKDCTEDEWCDANEGNCGACNGLWMDPNSIPATCIARWGECTNDIDGCCPSNACVAGNEWYKQCIPS
jgi:hypothetical protein